MNNIKIEFNQIDIYVNQYFLKNNLKKTTFKDFINLNNQIQLEALKMLSFALWEVYLIKSLNVRKFKYKFHFNNIESTRQYPRFSLKRVERISYQKNVSYYGNEIIYLTNFSILNLRIAVKKIRKHSFKSLLFIKSIMFRVTPAEAVQDKEIILSELPAGRFSLLGFVRGYSNLEKSHAFQALTNLISNQDSNKDKEINYRFDKQKHKIGVVTHALPSGGAEKQVILLVDALRRLGVQSHLLLTDELSYENSHHLVQAMDLGIEPISISETSLQEYNFLLDFGADTLNLLNPYFNPYAVQVFNLIKTIKKEGITHLISFLDNTNIICMQVSLILNIKCHVSFRSYAPDRMNHVEQERTKKFYDVLKNNKLLILSGNSFKGNEDYKRYLESDITIDFIENILDQKIMVPDSNNLSKPRDKQIDLIGVMRFSEEKNPSLFLDLVKELSLINKDIKAELYGSGPLLLNISKRLIDLKLENNLKINPSIRDISKKIQQSKILCLTSDFEGMPNVVLESMILGTPVCSTNVGAVSYLSQGFKNFIEFKPDAISKTAAELELILNNEEALIQKAQASRDVIENWRTAEQIAEDFLKKFDE